LPRQRSSKQSLPRRLVQMPEGASVALEDGALAAALLRLWTSKHPHLQLTRKPPCELWLLPPLPPTLEENHWLLIKHLPRCLNSRAPLLVEGDKATLPPVHAQTPDVPGSDISTSPLYLSLLRRSLDGTPSAIRGASALHVTGRRHSRSSLFARPEDVQIERAPAQLSRLPEPAPLTPDESPLPAQLRRLGHLHLCHLGPQLIEALFLAGRPSRVTADTRRRRC